MSGYVPSMVLLGGLYLEHRKEKLGKRFDTDQAWDEFMQFVKNKQADAWDEGYREGESDGLSLGHPLSTFSDSDRAENPYLKQEETR